MVTLKRIFLLVMLLLGALQMQAQYVIITSPAAPVTGPQCSVSLNPSTGEYDSPTQTFSLQLAGSAWGPAPGTTVTYELVNVYNTSQVYSTATAPTFSPNTPGGTATVTFKLPKLSYDCNDTIWGQVRVKYSSASPAAIYSSFARGFSFNYTPHAIQTSSAPYQVLDTIYREHCPGAFPQTLYGGSTPPYGITFQWQQMTGSAWSNIPGATANLYNATANGLFRCIVTSPGCGGCTMPSSPYLVKDIDVLQIYSSIPGSSPQVYTLGMSLQRSAPAVSYTYTGYQWYRNGIPISGATTQAYSPTSKGTYTLSGSGPCGWQMSNPFVLTDDCKGNGKVIRGPALSGTYTGILVMDGDYIVPSGTTVVIAAADILMRPCTRITVQKGATLNVVNSSVLHGCEQWYGIVVEGNGVLRMLQSTIKDAYIAVTAENDNSMLDFRQSTFKDNHLCIWSFKNRTAGAQQIHDNNLFTEIDLTKGDKTCRFLEPVAPHIDAIHAYIYIEGGNYMDIFSNNTFKGFPVGIAPDLYPCPVDAILGEDAAHITVTEKNSFTDLFRNGIKLDRCTEVEISKTNTFTGIIRYGTAISMDASDHIYIENSNSIKNYGYGITGADGEHITVRNNTISDITTGIRFNKIRTYDVSGNNISGTNSFTGMETYNDDFPPVMPPPCKISGNTFQGLYQALVISPVTNPLFWPTTAGNTLVNGSPQNIQILCNNFTGNTYAITGSAPIIDQYYQGQQWADNLFYQNSLWDIAWVDPGVVPTMNYYYNAGFAIYDPHIPNNSYWGQPQPPVLLNGIPVNTGYVSVMGNGNGDGDCNYDPFAGVPRPAGVAAAVNNSSAIAVYPNPAKDWLMVQAADGMVFSYDVINLAGQVVRTGKNGIHTQISVAGLTPGMYLLKLVTADGKTNNYKFMKE